VNLGLSWSVKQKRATDQQMSVLTAPGPAALTCTSEVVHAHVVEPVVVEVLPVDDEEAVTGHGRELRVRHEVVGGGREGGSQCWFVMSKMQMLFRTHSSLGELGSLLMPPKMISWLFPGLCVCV
jgi:hypothetical protein